MKKIVRITESDMVRLVKKIVKEHERIDDLADKYLTAIDDIFSSIDETSDQYDIEDAYDGIDNLIRSAEANDDLSEDEVDEIFNHGDSVLRELESMFDDGHTSM